MSPISHQGHRQRLKERFLQEGGFEHIFMGEEYGRFGGAEQGA